MNNEETKETLKLYIPSNLSIKHSFIYGFGKEELPHALFITTIGGIIAIIYNFINDDMGVSMGILIFSSFLGIILSSRDQNNLSVIDYILQAIRFNKEKQKFNYKPIKKWNI